MTERTRRRAARGRYDVRYIARGLQRGGEARAGAVGAVVLDVQLTLSTEAQVVNVEDEANRVIGGRRGQRQRAGAARARTGGASDDPDELAAQLQAMAGPGAGPNGGQIYIDGFTGGCCLRRVRSARSASIRIRFRRSTSGRDSAASRSSPGPAWIQSAWHGLRAVQQGGVERAESAADQRAASAVQAVLHCGQYLGTDLEKEGVVRI